MHETLKGVRVIECASFIAAPSAALYLAELGAEVIRIDQIGGGPDRNRWPLAPSGDSLYWEGLNKGKKSVAIDLSSDEGRELVTSLITAPGPDAGVFVTNFPVGGFLRHDRLQERRADLITLRIMGWRDGRNAVDYTVNAALGMPLMTGPVDHDLPVNHVLPAWDLLAGSRGAMAVLAALRQRDRHGKGQEIRLALADVAIAALGHVGQIGETLVGDGERPRMGNDLFGAFGRDFPTRDGRRVFIAAITSGQWRCLLKALDLGDEIAELEEQLGISFAREEGRRFEHRALLNPMVEAATASFDLAELAQRLDREGVCWDVYQGLGEALRNDPRIAQNPILHSIRHPSGETYPAPGSPVLTNGRPSAVARSAPRFGDHTEEVLEAVLGMSQGEIGSLRDRGIIAAA